MNKPIDEKTLAYIAGFFDADGCVGVYWNGKCYVLEVFITQKRTAILYWLQELFGGTVCRHSFKNTHRWKVSSQRALDFLLLICPYARYKRDQIGLAIEFQERMKPRAGKGLAEDEYSYQHFISEKLKRLKA